MTVKYYLKNVKLSDRFLDRADGRREGPRQDLPIVSADVLAQRPQGPDFYERPR